MLNALWCRTNIFITSAYVPWEFLSLHGRYYLVILIWLARWSASRAGFNKIDKFHTSYLVHTDSVQPNTVHVHWPIVQTPVAANLTIHMQLWNWPLPPSGIASNGLCNLILIHSKPHMSGFEDSYFVIIEENLPQSQRHPRSFILRPI